MRQAYLIHTEHLCIIVLLYKKDTLVPMLIKMIFLEIHFAIMTFTRGALFSTDFEFTNFDFAWTTFTQNFSPHFGFCPLCHVCDAVHCVTVWSSFYCWAAISSGMDRRYIYSTCMLRFHPFILVRTFGAWWLTDMLKTRNTQSSTTLC